MGILYIVATPIGNLGDITFRAVEILKTADLILCEDTRQTRKLLDNYKIETPVLSYHQHSKLGKMEQILEKLKKGENLALVSDAGTPGISDPGNKLISYLTKELVNLKVVPIPGPSAAIAALSVCGFPTDEFLFLGFVPHKKGRQTLFKKISETKETIVFYESTHRIFKTLEQLGEFLDKDRQVMIGRELTKMFETIYRGTLSEVLEQLKNDTIKGEFVIVISHKTGH